MPSKSLHHHRVSCKVSCQQNCQANSFPRHKVSSSFISTKMPIKSFSLSLTFMQSFMQTKMPSQQFSPVIKFHAKFCIDRNAKPKVFCVIKFHAKFHVNRNAKPKVFPIVKCHERVMPKVTEIQNEMVLQSFKQTEMPCAFPIKKFHQDSNKSSSAVPLKVSKRLHKNRNYLQIIQTFPRRGEGGQGRGFLSSAFLCHEAAEMPLIFIQTTSKLSPQSSLSSSPSQLFTLQCWWI